MLLCVRACVCCLGSIHAVTPIPGEPGSVPANTWSLALVALIVVLVFTTCCFLALIVMRVMASRWRQQNHQDVDEFAVEMAPLSADQLDALPLTQYEPVRVVVCSHVCMARAWCLCSLHHWDQTPPHPPDPVSVFVCLSLYVLPRFCCSHSPLHLSVDHHAPSA